MDRIDYEMKKITDKLDEQARFDLKRYDTYDSIIEYESTGSVTCQLSDLNLEVGDSICSLFCIKLTESYSSPPLVLTFMGSYNTTYLIYALTGLSQSTCGLVVSSGHYVPVKFATGESTIPSGNYINKIFIKRLS